MTTDYAVKIPYALGIVATRSIDEEVTGIKDLIADHRERIVRGKHAIELLKQLRENPTDELKTQFDLYKDDLGYGLLLKRIRPDTENATDAEIDQAARHTIPKVAPMFWTFRIMVFLGFYMLILIGLAFFYVSRHEAERHTWVLKALLWSIPVPWIAAEMGWFVAEFGRQPWSIAEILPTALSVSTIEASDVIMSLSAFIGFYSLLLVAELYLMFKYARLGPSSLKTGRYHFETQPAPVTGA